MRRTARRRGLRARRFLLRRAAAEAAARRTLSPARKTTSWSSPMMGTKAWRHSSASSCGGRAGGVRGPGSRVQWERMWREPGLVSVASRNGGSHLFLQVVQRRCSRDEAHEDGLRLGRARQLARVAVAEASRSGASLAGRRGAHHVGGGPLGERLHEAVQDLLPQPQLVAHGLVQPGARPPPGEDDVEANLRRSGAAPAGGD